MSSKFQTTLLIGIAVVVIALFLRQPEKQIPIVQDIQVTQPEEKSITVIGEADVKAKPDIVDFVIVIETSDKELSAAKRQNEETMLKLMTILEAHAIPQKDINSDYVRVKVEATNARIYKYIVNRTMKVTLHDLAEMESLFTNLQEAGFSQIEDIKFSISDIEAYRQKALQNAIQIAKEKAAATAKGIGLEVGQAISIQETTPLDRSYNPSFETYTVNDLNSSYVYSNMYSAVFTEITISTQVTAKFELK